VTLFDPTGTYEIVPGSIAHTALAAGGALPLPPVMVVILDVSYSMDERDAIYNAQRCRRIDAAKAQLIEIQAKFPGQVAIIAFSDEAEAVPGGVPPEPNGWTNLHLVSSDTNLPNPYSLTGESYPAESLASAEIGSSAKIVLFCE